MGEAAALFNSRPPAHDINFAAGNAIVSSMTADSIPKPELATAVTGPAGTEEFRERLPPAGHCFRLLGCGGPFAGKEFTLSRASMVIGRSDTDINLDDPSVSRRHAIIEIFDEGFALLKDLASTNGTRLNGNLISEGKLHAGDKFQVGDCEFEYRAEKIIP